MTTSAGSGAAHESVALPRHRESPGASDVTVEKSVALRRGLVEDIEARAGAGGFSAFLDMAADRYLTLLQAEDHGVQFGLFTIEELAEERAAWLALAPATESGM